MNQDLNPAERLQRLYSLLPCLGPLHRKEGERKERKSGGREAAGDWVSPLMMGFDVPSWPTAIAVLWIAGGGGGGCQLAKANSICSVDEMTLVLGAIFTWAGSKETGSMSSHVCSQHTCTQSLPPGADAP